MMWCKEISEGAHVGTTTHQGTPGVPGAPRWVVPVGQHSNFKKILRTCKIMVMHSNERGSVVYVAS